MALLVPALAQFKPPRTRHGSRTLAGRVGLTLDRTLVYFKIGGGWVRNNATIANLTSATTVSASNTNGGWLIGAGAEYAFPFLPHWSAKLEYEFLDLGDQTGLALFDSGTFAFRPRRAIVEIWHQLQIQLRTHTNSR